MLRQRLHCSQFAADDKQLDIRYNVVYTEQDAVATSDQDFTADKSEDTLIHVLVPV